MLSRDDRQSFKPDKITSLLFWIIFFALMYCVWLIYQIYIFSFFIALLFYLLLRKPYLFFLNIVGGRRNLASAFASLFTIVVIVVPLFFLIQTLAHETFTAVKYLQHWLTKENLYHFYEKNEWLRYLAESLTMNISTIQEQLLQLTTGIGSILFQQSREIVSGVFEILFNFIIMIATLFFLFHEGEKIPPFIYSLLPFPDSLEEEIGGRLLHVLDVMMKGTGLISLAQGLSISIYFWSFGLSTPILYGSIAAIFSLVPVLGTMVVWLPGSLFLYWQGKVLSAFCLSIFSIVTYLGLENIVKPLLLDKKLSLHPLFLFLAILGGVAEFGIKGFILGPFVVIAFLIILEFIKVWNTKNV